MASDHAPAPRRVYHSNPAAPTPDQMDREFDRLARAAYLSARDGTLDGETAFDLASTLITWGDTDPALRELAELSLEDTNRQRITELTRHVLAERFEPGSDLEPGLLAPLEAALEAVKADMHATGLPGPIRLVLPEWSDPPRAFVEYRGGWGSTSGMLRGRRQAGLGTGERSAELTSLLGADRCAAPYPGRYVVCTRALALVEALTGLGVRHSWELLLDLARNWVIAVPLIDTQGNIGSHTWRPKPIDHGTSSAGFPVPARPSSTPRHTASHPSRQA